MSKKKLIVKDNFEKVGKDNFIRLAMQALKASKGFKYTQALTSIAKQYNIR